MKQERKPYHYQGRVVYEWDEGLDTVYCFIEMPPLPANIKPSSITQVKISPNMLIVGLKNTAPYLTHTLQGIADAQESLWYIQQKKDKQGKNTGGKQIVIELQKAQKGVRWGCVFKGHDTMNIMQAEDLKKKLLLERFQEENPGFDFSSAQFNGQVPEARDFMGGPKS